MSVRDLIILGTSSQQPTRTRNHGAYLLRWNQEGFLFDPGEGTQRQFIFAEVSPPVVTRIFISHFHGDHCLGIGSMLMRLNLDKVKHPIHCYFPKSGKKYFDRLRFGCMYHEQIQIIEHPIEKEGIVEQDEHFKIEARFLNHGVESLGYRIQEADELKFDKEKLKKENIQGPSVKKLEEQGFVKVGQKKVFLKDVSWVREGNVFSYVVDTRPCNAAKELARDADLFLCESTFLSEHEDLAHSYMHMTAKQAALLAKEAHVKKLILTHFSARYQQEQLFQDEAREIFPESYAAKDLNRYSFPKT